MNKKLIVAVLAAAALIGSVAIFAHINAQESALQSGTSKTVIIKAESKTQPQSPTPEQTTQTTTDGSCTKTTTSDVDNTPPNTHDNQTTTVNCQGSGNSSLNITNNSSQSATSGNVTNDNSSDTEISQ